MELEVDKMQELSLEECADVSGGFWALTALAIAVAVGDIAVEIHEARNYEEKWVGGGGGSNNPAPRYQHPRHKYY